MDNRRRKLLYRSIYRGMREMDIILGNFARAYLEAMTDKELELYEEVLNITDDVLYKFLRSSVIPINLELKRNHVLQKLKEYSIKMT